MPAFRQRNKSVRMNRWNYPCALLLANRADESLAERGELYVQSLIDKNRVVAAFLPTVSFQPGFTAQQVATGQAAGAVGVTNTVTGFQVSGQHQTRFEAPIVGSMNLFRGGADIANLRSANATIEQRRQLLLDLQATVLLNVAQTYYQVLRSEGQVLVLRHSLTLQNAAPRRCAAAVEERAGDASGGIAEHRAG